MPLSQAELDQIRGLIQEVVVEAFKPLVGEIDTRINTTVSGAVKRMKAEYFTPLENKFISEVEGFRTALSTTVKSSVDELLEQLAEQELSPRESNTSGSHSTAKGTTAPTNHPVEALIAAAIAEFEEKTKPDREKLEWRVKAAEAAQATAEAERHKVAEQSRIRTMETAIITTLSGKVRPGSERRLLTLMRNEGLLVDDQETNAYRVKTRDRYGDPVLIPLEDKLKDILEGTYPEYLPIRPATGAGTASAATSYTPTHGSTFGEGTTAQEIYAAINDNDDKFKQATAALDAAIQA